ncbi:ABC transporter ATP-binding protein [Arsukibacterium sp.]|uniref:ABC transporter ATP-binding protein n=1 Tax=Arsukibacterium sp. TaxID=1977258 RepID=UPI00299E2BCD|nr:ATP-binding cassette domain-containing protein [Arsukibacterium sp.]MDX1678479.1 ATP-binding cassette domain-containing protein [Arsukibacterium sp.]
MTVHKTVPDSAPVIRIRSLVNRFGSQVVHRELDLDVQQGEILAVVGGSGSGKSVLMRSILGLLRPASGTIEVFEDEITEASALQQLMSRYAGVLFQEGALFSSLTVLENVMLPLQTRWPDMSALLCRQLAVSKLGLVGLSPETGLKMPAELSGGMRKRAALARALVLEPEILFLDEPTSGLDPIGAAEFDSLLKTLQQALQFTVFMITHDLDTLYAIADRVAVIADQKIVTTATPDEVVNHSHPWIRDYFTGPRARSARQQHAKRTG